MKITRRRVVVKISKKTEVQLSRTGAWVSNATSRALTVGRRGLSGERHRFSTCLDIQFAGQDVSRPPVGAPWSYICRIRKRFPCPGRLRFIEIRSWSAVDGKQFPRAACLIDPLRNSIAFSSADQILAAFRVRRLMPAGGLPRLCQSCLCSCVRGGGSA